jgi:biopolymer transport protein ExbB/TolQ
LKKDPHHLFLVWLIFTGLIIFTLFVSWHENILILLYAGDKSRISWAITLLYLIVTFHCILRVHYISNQLNATQKIKDLIQNENNLDIRLSDGRVHVNGNHVLPDSVLSEYLYDLIYKTKHENINNKLESNKQNNDLIDVYESRLKKPHDIGWFVTDIMVKLGLLGTIIGFVLMLGTVSNITDFDLSTVQKILSHMSAGMGTALYTTFAGLVCSILAGVQYHMLDRGADDVIEVAKHLSSVYVVPKLNSGI